MTIKMVALAAAMAAVSGAALAQSVPAPASSVAETARDRIPSTCTSPRVVAMATMLVHDGGMPDARVSARARAVPVVQLDHRAKSVTCEFNIAYPNPIHLSILARPLFGYHSTLHERMKMLFASADGTRMFAYRFEVGTLHGKVAKSPLRIYPSAYAQALHKKTEAENAARNAQVASAVCSNPVFVAAARRGAAELLDIQPAYADTLVIGNNPGLPYAPANEPGACFYTVSDGEHYPYTVLAIGTLHSDGANVRVSFYNDGAGN